MKAIVVIVVSSKENQKTYIIAVRGSNSNALLKEVEGILELLSSKTYRDCFTYNIYIIVRDKQDRCYGAESLIRQLADEPSVVVLGIDKFLREIGVS